MKARYLILSVLLVLALMMAGCTDNNGDNTGDVIEEDDDTGDDDDTNTGDYTKLTIKELVETPYSYNGKDVEVKNAKIISIKTDYSCTISDDSTTETIILYSYDESLGLKPGDILDVKGLFEQYQNQDWQIKIRSEKATDQVKVTGSETVTYKEMTVKELLENPDSFNGLLVKIKDATVTTEYLGGKFNISDDSTSDNLLVFKEYGANAPHITLNDKIDIMGEFMKFYDWQVKVRKESDDKITVVGETVDTYEEVTLAKLVGDPDAYENKFVRVADATVEAGGVNWKFNISDGSGNTIVVYTEKFADGGIVSISEGDNVEVKGQVTYYETYWQIKIRKNTDDKITKLSSGEPTEYTYLGTDIATLLDNATNTQYRDKSVKLMGVVVVTKSSNYNYIFGVNDTAGPFNINLTVYGQEVDDLAVNDTVNVYGLFEWYGDKGYWEIKIRKNSTDKVEKV